MAARPAAPPTPPTEGEVKASSPSSGKGTSRPSPRAFAEHKAQSPAASPPPAVKRGAPGTDGAQPVPDSTCRICHDAFKQHENGPEACRFHTGMFVCRWHPDEVGVNYDKLGDGIGYYGGTKGWQAKFWDCCGAEDAIAPGCATGPHETYDAPAR